MAQVNRIFNVDIDLINMRIVDESVIINRRAREGSTKKRQSWSVTDQSWCGGSNLHEGYYKSHFQM